MDEEERTDVEREELERRLLEGLDSTLREMTPERWQELREALRHRLPKGNSQREA